VQKTIFVAVIAVGAMLAISSFTSPKGVRPTGNACLGQNNDSLVEYIGNHCQAGDTIATKHPAYFCDFNHTVAFNTFNSAMCIYTGKQAGERVPAATPASSIDQNPKTGS
jgi:hypothetical protein